MPSFFLYGNIFPPNFGSGWQLILQAQGTLQVHISAMIPECVADRPRLQKNPDVGSSPMEAFRSQKEFQYAGRQDTQENQSEWLKGMLQRWTFWKSMKPPQKGIKKIILLILRCFSLKTKYIKWRPISILNQVFLK